MIENYVPRPTVDEFSETKIYPSYSKGRIFIEFPVFDGSLEIKIYDIMGDKYMMKLQITDLKKFI